MDEEKRRLSELFWSRKIEISKIEAARRQIDCAIELWFLDRDEVSIHTLAAAAYQIVHDIKESRGEKRDLLYDSVLVKPEYRNKWISAVKKWANFLKHADTDPEGTMEFMPFGNLMFIIFAIAGLRMLGEQTSYPMNALWVWLTIHQPSLVTAEFRKHFADRVPIEDVEGIRLMPKADFFKSYIRLSAGPR
jgi:hypothetical protein